MTRVNPHSIRVAASGFARALVIVGCGTSTPAGATTPGAHNHSSATPSTPATAPAGTTSTSVVTTPSAAPGGATIACALVTEQDATAALGKDPGPGSKFESHGSTQCQYGSAQTAFLLVNLTPSHGRAGYDHIHNNPSGRATVHVVDLTGVGDRAFEVAQHNSVGIVFSKGDAVVAVSLLIRAATSPPAGQALALAKIAASRL